MKKLVYHRKPNWLVRMVADLLYEYVYEDYGKYIDDSDFWADQCEEMSRPLMALIQRQYTLAHIGCSVVSFWDDKAGEMVCIRSLDWSGADNLAPCTRKFILAENDGTKQNVQVAGIAGMVGMLTGMKEQFSICINYAPWASSARFHADPTFLIRDLLSDDTVISYEEACDAVNNWKTGAPCFISLCGREKGEACVVEFGEGDLRKTRTVGSNGYIAQTNHYDKTSPFKDHNKEDFYKDDQFGENGWYWSDLLKNSEKRRGMIDAIMNDRPTDVNDIAEHILTQYCTPPLINFETAQWVVMRPKSMQMDIYKCTTKKGCPPNPS